MSCNAVEDQCILRVPRSVAERIRAQVGCGNSISFKLNGIVILLFVAPSLHFSPLSLTIFVSDVLKMFSIICVFGVLLNREHIFLGVF